MNLRRLKQLIFPAAALVALAASLAPAGPMADEHLYDVPTSETVIAEAFIDRLRQAADQPDVLTRVETLKAIALHRIDALTDKAVALLADERPAVRLEAIRTIDALDYRKAADKLLGITMAGKAEWPAERELVILADGLLAKWDDTRAAPAWAKRLGDSAVPQAIQVSALRALAVSSANDAGIEQAVQAIAMNTKAPATIRLVAAGTLGARVKQGAETDARQLMAEGMFGRVLAVRVLASHQAGPALKLLGELAVDDQPAVAAAAMQTLLDIDPKLVWPYMAASLRRPDPKVRDIAARSLATRTEAIAVEALVPVLDDAHPDVRTHARESLRQLAAIAALKPQILQAAEAILKRDAAADADQQAGHWRDVEQAATLIGELDHKAAWSLLWAIRDFERREVREAAIISLRELSVPDTFPLMTQYMGELINRANTGSSQLEGLTDAAELQKATDRMTANASCAALVAEALGYWRVAEADSVLRPIIKKLHPIGSQARTAGIWAIGLIREDRPDAGLSRTMAQRIADVASMYPEDDNVRLACIVAIGRMRDPSQEGNMRNYYNSGMEGYEIRTAAGWALGRITRQPVAPIETSPRVIRSGFVTPLD